MLSITPKIKIPLSEIHITAIRSQGSGGQNVNKVSTAIQLRFNITQSSLPVQYKQNLLKRRDQRITKDGDIIIKSQNHRSQSKNRDAALFRLQNLIRSAGIVRKPRKLTKPSRKSIKKRLDSKCRKSLLKSLRKKIL